MRRLLLLSFAAVLVAACEQFPGGPTFVSSDGPSTVVFDVSNSIGDYADVVAQLGDVDTVEATGMTAGIIPWEGTDVDEWINSDSRVATLRPLRAAECRMKRARTCAALTLVAEGRVEIRASMLGAVGVLRLRVVRPVGSVAAGDDTVRLVVGESTYAEARVRDGRGAALGSDDEPCSADALPLSWSAASEQVHVQHCYGDGFTTGRIGQQVQLYGKVPGTTQLIVDAFGHADTVEVVVTAP